MGSEYDKAKSLGKDGIEVLIPFRIRMGSEQRSLWKSGILFPFVRFNSF